MSRFSVNLIDSLAIIQGETYKLLTESQVILLDGDWTGGVERGQIRTDIIANAGILLADFEFEPSVYDADTNKTWVKPFLSDAITAAIAPTSYKTGKTPSVRNCYVYDVEIEKEGLVAKVAFGFIQVIGEVTGGNDVIVKPPIIWDGAIDHISLTFTNGLIKTYTAWGDESETIDLGSFDVEDGNGIESTNYDGLTGILTIEFTDGTNYQTGDIRGEKGDQGIQGNQGIQGEKGLSSYEVAANNGFSGTEQEWLDSLVGEKGDQGIQGIQGEKGDKGEPGDDAPPQTPEQIKTAYESNANTNAFTNAEKFALGTALQPSDIANFETSTQLNARDTANRIWTNLTSVPGWITNATAFGQSLVTAASSTAAKTLLSLTKSDVGLADVDNTSDANKPISSATQSALNLKAPLNNPTFTGTNLILPNNSRINGIEHFYQATKPITRGDGTALVAGDRWWKIDDGTEWFWNGTYWLSPLIHGSALFPNAPSATGFLRNLSIERGRINTWFLLSFYSMHFTRTAAMNASNYWELSMVAWFTHGTSVPNSTCRTSDFADSTGVGNSFYVYKELNFVFTNPGYAFQINYTKVGEPGQMFGTNYCVGYHFIHP